MAVRGARSALVVVAFAFASCVVHGQTPTQIQYTYDAAGNVIGVTRSSAPGSDLTISNLTIDLIAKNANGSFSVTVTYTITNSGTVAASPTWYDRAYLSAEQVLQDTDQILGGANTRSTSLAPGTSYTTTTTFTTSTTTAAGTYYMFVKADGGAGTGQFAPTGPNVVPELNEFNNAAMATVTLPANPKPDLIVTNLAVGTIGVNQTGDYSIPVTFQVRNIGSLSTAVGWNDRGYLSTNSVLEDTDQALGTFGTRATPLAPGVSYPVSLTFTSSTTTTPGNYTLIVKADGTAGGGTFVPTGPGLVAELNESNNTQSVAISLPTKPDLTLSNVVVGTITASQSGTYSIPVTFRVNNVGGSAALATPSAWADRGYLSTDATLQNTDAVLTGSNIRTTPLAAGANYNASVTFVTSATTAPGNYSLIVKADGGSVASGQYAPTGAATVIEQVESNNTFTTGITLPVRADLSVSNLVVGAITPRAGGGYNIPVTFQVNNVGGSPAVASWADRGYLSTDATLSDSDQILGAVNIRTTNLAAGASYPVSLTLTTNASTTPGTYTLYVKADGGGVASGQFGPTGAASVTEANETNNTASRTVVLP